MSSTSRLDAIAAQKKSQLDSIISDYYSLSIDERKEQAYDRIHEIVNGYNGLMLSLVLLKSEQVRGE